MPRSMVPLRLAPAAALVLLALAGCTGGSGGSGGSGPVELGAFPLDDVGELLSDDPRLETVSDSHDGQGSVHVYVDDTAQFNLVEVETPDFEGDTVVVRAAARSMTLAGYTSVELLIFQGDEDARILRRPFEGLSRTTEWRDREIRFALAEGVTPDRIRVMLHLSGRGHVWIDDLRVLSARAEDLEDE